MECCPTTYDLTELTKHHLTKQNQFFSTKTEIQGLVFTESEL